MKVLLNQRQRKILEILSRENGCITSLEISKNLSRNMLSKQRLSSLQTAMMSPQKNAQIPAKARKFSLAFRLKMIFMPQKLVFQSVNALRLAFSAARKNLQTSL